MKNYTIKYVKGHLIDQETGKRIFLKRGGTFNLLGDDNQFEEKDDLSLSINPLNAKNKIDSLYKKHKGYVLEKVANAGDVFLYRVGLSKKTQEDKENSFLLKAVLLEDLYIKSKNKKWSLCDCYCETNHCLDGDLQIFESVYGTSLSNLFSNIVAFYFPLQRSGACNAFNTFYLLNKSDTIHYNLQNYKIAHNQLDFIRAEVTLKYKKNE